MQKSILRGIAGDIELAAQEYIERYCKYCKFSKILQCCCAGYIQSILRGIKRYCKVELDAEEYIERRWVESDS